MAEDTNAPVQDAEANAPAADPNRNPQVENVDPEAEKQRKTAPQDRTTNESTEHVTVHLDRDPNDPRNAEPTPKLPSMDDKSQQGPKEGRVGIDQ